MAARDSSTYQATLAALSFLFNRYFREIDISGLGNVPAAGGGVVVSWHPNGMIDPGLILTFFPRQIVFGARDGLFRWPLLGAWMAAMGAVPIYRSKDAEAADDPAARRAANRQSLARLAGAIQQGGFACLFPEGDSHDAPFLLELKTGAARLLRQAWQRTPPGEPPPALLPVGLHYDRKQSWGSDVLIAFLPPLPLPRPPPEPDAPDEAQRAWDEEITALIERALHDAVHATESWRLHQQLHHIRTLLRAEHAHRAGARLQQPRIGERTLGFSRAWTAHSHLREHAPDDLDALLRRTQAYADGLHDLQMEDDELDRARSLLRPGLAGALLLQAGLVFVLLPPVILVGVLINGPPAAFLLLFSRMAAKRIKDIASIRLLLGALLFPLTWIVAGVAAAYAQTTLATFSPLIPETPVLVGLVTVALSLVGAVLALMWLRIARETARALRVRLTRVQRRLVIARLRVERAELYDRFHELTRGIDLPGAVRPDGVVIEDESLQHLPEWIP